MEVVKLFALATLASLIPGQLVRLNLSEASFTVSDILVLLTDTIFIWFVLITRRKVFFPRNVLLFASLFILAALTSNVLAIVNFGLISVATSSLFLIRLILYLFLIVVIKNIVKTGQITNWLNVILSVGAVFLTIGLLGLVFFPDLSPLTQFGWDPHQSRIVSSLLDPNFSGMVFNFFFAISISLFLFSGKKIYLLMGVLSFTAVVLTFSRSSYLALLIISLVVGIVKSPKFLILAIGAMAAVIVLIPQARERVAGAITVDDTAQARLTSWQNALVIFRDHPIFGVGFNNYRGAQAKYAFFEPGETGGHSGGGSDSSLLTVAATTGITGLVFFCLFLAAIFKRFLAKVRQSPLHLAGASSFFGLLIHSQFTNSLFFPQIMIILYFLTGLAATDDT